MHKEGRNPRTFLSSKVPYLLISRSPTIGALDPVAPKYTLTLTWNLNLPISP
jgi:hypothetical protein